MLIRNYLTNSCTRTSSIYKIYFSPGICLTVKLEKYCGFEPAFSTLSVTLYSPTATTKPQTMVVIPIPSLNWPHVSIPALRGSLRCPGRHNRLGGGVGAPVSRTDWHRSSSSSLHGLLPLYSLQEFDETSPTAPTTTRKCWSAPSRTSSRCGAWITHNVAYRTCDASSFVSTSVRSW